MAEEGRKLFREHADAQFDPKDAVCVSADLQKIIMLPRVDCFKSVLFIKRLIAYHETFAPVGKKSKLHPCAVVWHEGISGRWKEDIISTFRAFLLQQRDCKRIYIWLDNCASQNKNWTLFSFLVQMIHSPEIESTEIVLFYFEPGHTFMSADSFHHQVELALNRQAKTYDFHDFSTAVSSANRGKVHLIPMQHTDFYNWEDHTSQAKLKKAAQR